MKAIEIAYIAMCMEIIIFLKLFMVLVAGLPLLYSSGSWSTLTFFLYIYLLRSSFLSLTNKIIYLDYALVNWTNYATLWYTYTLLFNMLLQKSFQFRFLFLLLSSSNIAIKFFILLMLISVNKLCLFMKSKSFSTDYIHGFIIAEVLSEPTSGSRMISSECSCKKSQRYTL